MQKLLKKYRDIISYLFFGICTTLVNFIVYSLFARYFNFHTVPSTGIAWVTAVIFAYLTNRKWVFKSSATKFSAIVQEIIFFFLCRLLTGILDIIIMYVFVDLLNVNDLFMKLISNIVVIIINYLASKFIIFRKKEDK